MLIDIRDIEMMLTEVLEQAKRDIIGKACDFADFYSSFWL